MIGRFGLATVTVWLVLAALIFGRFADEPLPPGYLARPLMVAVGLAVVIGAGSLIARRHAVAIAAGAAVLLALPYPVIVLTVVGVLIGAELLLRRGRMASGSQRPVLIMVGLFFLLGMVRAVSVIDRSPHPPFLYGARESATPPRWCWPACGMFSNAIENLGITKNQWADGMAAQLDGLNARLIEAIDRLIARHPDAVIVLFSDHGGRITSAEPDEWHHSFLAARTPGHPELFAAAPRPDTIIRTLLSTYAETPPASRVSGNPPTRRP